MSDVLTTSVLSISKSNQLKRGDRRARQNKRSGTERRSTNTSGIDRTTNQTTLRISPLLTSSFLSTEGGFAQKSRVLLKYQETVVSGSVTAAASNYFFNLNSLFDPNRTGTGHQPQYSDIWKQIYNRYRVTEAKVRISTYGAVSQEIALVIQNHANAYTSVSLAQEQPWSISRANAQPSGFAVLECTVPLHIIQGSTPAQYLANEDTSAVSGANPAEVIIADVVLQDWNSLSTSSTPVKVEIWYTVEFFDRIQLQQS